MSQPTTFNIPEVGPESPVSMASFINDALDALKSGHIGSTRPSYAEKGTIWLQETSSPSEITAYLYDGVDDIEIGTFDVSGNTFTPAGSGNAYALNLASQAQAEAGTSNTVLMTPLRVAEAISALSTSSVDQVARDGVATNAIMLAISNDLTSLGLTGSVGNRFLIDDFRSDSLATKTGATYDSTNDWYSNVTSTDDGTAGETQTNTAELNSGVGDHGGMQFTAAASGSVVEATFQIQTVTTPGNYHVEIWSNSVNNPSAQVGSDSSSVNITTSGVKTFTWATGPSLTSSTVYWAVLVPEGASNVTASMCAAVSGFKSCRANVITSLNATSEINASLDFIFGVSISTGAGLATLAPIASTITTGAQDLLGYFAYDPVDSVTLGTDITVEASIDGGSTYSTSSLTSVGAVGATGELLFRSQSDVSGQSGTSLIYRLKLDAASAGKEIRYTNCVGLIPLYT